MIIVQEKLDTKLSKENVLETGTKPFLFSCSFLFAYFVFLRFFRLDFQSLWYDELMVWYHHMHPTFSSFIENFSLMDRNPPGYFLLSWFLSPIIPHNEIALRIPSAVLGACSVGLIYVTAKNFWDKKTALWATFFLGVNASAIALSQEARPYSLVIFLTLAHLFTTWKTLNSGTNKSLMASATLAFLSGLALSYTHYIGLVFVFFYGCGLFFLFRASGKQKIWLSIYGLMALCFVPWVSVLWQKATQESVTSNSFPSGKDFLDHFYFLFGHARVFAGATLVLVILMIVKKVRNKFAFKYDLVACLLFAALSTYGLSLILSLTKVSLTNSRYFTVLLPVVLLLAARLFSLSSFILTKNKVLAILVWLSILDAGIGIWGRNYYFEPRFEQNREAVSDMIKWSHEKSAKIIAVDGNERIGSYYFSYFLKSDKSPVTYWLPHSTTQSIPQDSMWLAVLTRNAAWETSLLEELQKNFERVNEHKLRSVTSSLWKRKDAPLSSN